jgi:peptidoglycan/xylan/chitin deacetylase (PgdA/CDA1 family)
MYLVRPPFLLKNLYREMLWRVRTKEKIIFLSFDDGPHPEITGWVLDQLKVHDAKAIFFCVGENVQRYPEMYARILAEGHLTGNHTHNHLNGWNSDSRVYLKNLVSCSHLVHTSFFRPPYGRLKKSQAERIRKHFTIVMWDVLSGDFDHATTPEKCLDNTLKYSREGSVVVFHDSVKARENLVYVLPRYLEEMKRSGYRFETFISSSPQAFQPPSSL